MTSSGKKRCRACDAKRKVRKRNGDERTTIRSVSYGGGVQSNAMLVLAAQGIIDYNLFLFANTGDDSESPATLEYVRNIAMPYAEKHGIELIELKYWKSDGQLETLWGKMMAPGSKSLPIPVRLSDTNAPGRRSCTSQYKIQVILRELRRRGTSKENPAITALGISTDEIQRAKPGLDEISERQIRVYPLLDLGLSREDCKRIISEAGLPVPPKSACFFCPFHNKQGWLDLRRDTPELFEKSILLENTLNDRQIAMGRERVWLTGKKMPLAEAVESWGPTATGDCESGYCMT